MPGCGTRTRKDSQADRNDVLRVFASVAKLDELADLKSKPFMNKTTKVTDNVAKKFSWSRNLILMIYNYNSLTTNSNEKCGKFRSNQQNLKFRDAGKIVQIYPSIRFYKKVH